MKIAQSFAFACCILAFVACADDSGSCGENVQYTYSSKTKTLTISGTGEMTNYSYYDSPWSMIAKDIETVVVNEGVTSIGSYSFYDFYRMKNVTLPSTLTFIGGDSFRSCRALESIEIPQSVETLESYAFFFCSKLKSIDIPGNIQTIDSATFLGCDSLETVTFHEGLSFIQTSAFKDCISLTNLTFPTSLTYISNSAFYNCSSLVSVDLPMNLSYIHDTSFSACSSLEFLTVDGDNPDYKAVDNVLFNKKGTTLVLYPGGKKGPYTVPDTVDTIGESAFMLCSGITHVTIPANVSSIGYSAFELSSVVTVSYLGTGNPCDRYYHHTFSNCKKLEFVCVPNISQSFCDRPTLWTNDDCEIFREKENECYHIVVTNRTAHTWSFEKRPEAQQWEKQKSGCMTFICDNSSGLTVLSSCISGKDNNQYCLNDHECTKKDVVGKRYVVKISIEDGDTPVEPGLDILDNLGSVASSTTYTWMISTEMNEKRHYVRLFVYVDDEYTAESIAYGVESLKDRSYCYYGVLCYATNVEITVDSDAPILSSEAASCRNIPQQGLLLVFTIMMMRQIINLFF